MLRIAFLFFMLLGVTSVASATIYYVAPNGSDATSGALERPWATLQHAVDTIAPGDTILVQSGTYAGCRIERSGEEGKPCTLQAAPKAKVLLNKPGPNNRHESILEIERYDNVVRYWVIDGFEVANSPRYGIDLRGTDHCIVQNCEIYESKVTGIMTAFSDHVLVQNIYTHDNHEHGIYFANSGDNGVIRGNRIFRNDGCGLHMNADASAGGDGIISNMTVENNIVWENGVRGGSALNACGVCDSIFRNNLCYDNHAGGISLYIGEANVGSSRNKVYNNTIVMVPNTRWVVNIPNDSNDPRLAPTDNQIVNNILYVPDANHGSFFIYDPVQAKLVSDFNIVVDRFCPNGDDVNISFKQWQELGFDQHSIIADPKSLFVNAEKHDYHLRKGSPARKAGKVLSEVTRNIEGKPRGKDAVNIGAY